MPDALKCRETLSRFLKARVPFISVRTPERGRAIELLRQLATEIGIAIYVHTLSQGMRDIGNNRVVSEDRSVVGALDFSAQQMAQRQNLTFVFTEVSDLEDDTPTARQFYDLVMLASERGGALAVITTKPVWGQLQRLGMTVTLDPPTEDEMLTILHESIDPYRPSMPIEWTDAQFREAASILAGITRIEAENVVATLLANGAISAADLVELSHVKDRIFSDISGIERVTIRSEELAVGGLNGLRTWLERERPLLTADLRDRHLRPPRGVLLVGVPGCGKSLSAKSIAATWNLPLYRLDLATIHGQYLGQSEHRLKEALATADHVAPCVLWIDEIEKGLAGATGGGDGGTSTRLVGQFLFWLQEARARTFVVATANDVSRLPPELLRRGRFDELFFVDLPSAEERRDIIDIYIRRNLRYQASDVLVGELMESSEGFAGADIEAAVREVAKEAVRRGDGAINDEIFRRSFANIVPLSKTSPEQIEQIRAWGRERAVPASGTMGAAPTEAKGPRRAVLV
ncbi:MAG: AAA family ATPase [Deltaproteobacteria bacterium]|nr:AAA family ATPase [Deltaproteobacteria bacterium]